MAYTNSSMVVYTKFSPNHSGQRTHSIDRITPHCVVGQCTAEGLGEWFEKQSTQASSNYGIDKDGRVALYVEEKNRSWCSSMMIDESFQGKGYGRAALNQIIEYIKAKPFGDSSRIALTCNKNNYVAKALYENIGFSSTGVEDEDEIELVMNV